ncbi:MAG: NAD-glutamate dehydrogenase, partial [Leptospiraceae bacterium]|nr:NAD-glutamate dehydrogenase [Leptospiraceae bacterium]
IERWLTQILDNLYVEEPDFAVDADPEYGMIWILGIVSGREASAFSPNHVERVARQLHFDPEITIRRRMNEHDLLFLSVRPTEGTSFDSLLTELKHSVHQLFASWQNRFRKSLTNHFIGERLIEQKLAMYRAALSPSAEVHQEPEEALQDLIRLEELDESHPLKAAFHRRKEEVYVKIYSLSPRPIGDLVPVLANFGFRVTDEFTFPGRFPESTRYIYAYRIQDTDMDPRFDTSLARVLEATILGNNSDEPVNRLAVFGLDQYQLSLVKGLQAYLFQIDRTFSRAFIARASLSQRPFIASLIAFLECRFAPGQRDSERLKKEQTLESATRQLLEQISSVMESLLCNRLLEIANAIVRTNYYQQSPEVSFKVHSQAISALPGPVPLFEIFVYSSRFEAVHLRGANIARGGIRWSDRPDDFRTEIHGLMKAQMVKNTVIVPSGSKGGFCLKGDRATDPAFALECYRTFMANLLRLTDNRTPTGKIKRPPLTCLDPADPYLVVAADKGTARFSDDANEVAQAMHFWLGDAFASGGRHGYDHKKQGITARGAWQSVRRHFYEMGQDPETDPITVAGIGDMAGDVFGNGMLLSKSMKLVAAFNHKHIFLDPDPSTESWKERKRLFDNVLGWDQYKTSLISNGGGVFDRSSARISISSEVAEVLGIAPATMSGEELIRAILCARVDLLWNGGIGTYVKASTESHADAMDPANDRVRVNGNQLRARVIGEGGNLGWTQKARIEAAAVGVRMNTDAVDNSGGVDMSDHEVNLKILLEKLVRTEQIADVEQRNRWISRLESRMIELVLDNNVAANLCLSLDQKRLKPKSDAFLATLRWLEDCGHSLDGVSSDELHASDNPARLLSRPVLCSMLGHAKLELKKEILGSDSINESELESWLFSYFPDELVEAFKEDVAAHPLRKEIIVTGILNHCVDYGGITFFWTVRQRTGADPARIAKARLAVEHFMRAEGLRDQEHPHAKAELNHLLGIEEQLESMTAMLLRYRKDPMEIFRLGASEKQRFAAILERLEVMQNEAGIRTGAESMDLAFWFFLQSERKQPLPESALGRYLDVLQSPSMQAVDRYLKSPMSSSVAEMRFHRRIRAQRDRIVLQIVLDRIPLDRLSLLADLFDGDDTPRSLAIFEGLEEMSVAPHTGSH